MLTAADTMDDADLIEALRTGDREAVRLLYDRYKNGLFTLARALLGDASAAEDVVHDVFVSFVESVEKYRVNGNLRGYLATSVTNRVHDRIRLAARHAGRAAGSEAPEKADPAPDAAAILHEETQRLRWALAGLPYEQREALLLHLQAGLTFKEIARLQGVSISTAQGRYRYGVERLRSMLMNR